MHLMDLSFAFTSDTDYVLYLNTACDGTELKIVHFKNAEVKNEKPVFRITLQDDEIDDLIHMLKTSRKYNQKQKEKDKEST